MSILLQGGRFKKRLMPILLSVALAGCSNLFGSSFTQTLQRDANASSEFYILSPRQSGIYKILHNVL